MQRQLEILGAQRAGLEDMLKDMKRKVCLKSQIHIIRFLVLHVGAKFPVLLSEDGKHACAFPLNFMHCLCLTYWFSHDIQ